MFVLGWINRRESHLAYFGALSVGWAIVESRLWLRDLPFDNAVAEFLLCAMLPLLTWAAVQFLLRYAQYRHRWVDIGLPLQALLMPAIAAAGRAGAAVPDGQLLVRAAGAADAGRRRLLPAHAVPRAPPLVLADGAAAVHRHRGAGGGVRVAEVRHPLDVHAAGADRHAVGDGAGGLAPAAAAGARAAGRRRRQGPPGAAHPRSDGRDRTQLHAAGGTARREGHRTRAQAHRRRPARRPGRQAADDRAHQRFGAHLARWRARRWKRCACRCAA